MQEKQFTKPSIIIYDKNQENCKRGRAWIGYGERNGDHGKITGMHLAAL